MFKYTLYFNREKDRAIYGPSRTFRGFSIFFSFLLIYFFVLSCVEGDFTASALVPLTIAIILFFSALLQDEFIFDKKERTLTINFGFGPFYKKEVFSFDDIKELELSHFLKGKYGKDQKSTKHNKAQVVLTVMLESGDEKKMEVYSERSSAGKLEEIAHKLSLFTGFPLYVDRDREEEPIDLKSLR